MKSPIFYLCVVCLTSTTLVQAQSQLKRAIVKPEHIESIIEIEKRFASNYEALPPTDSNWFAYLPGVIPILVIAGHATAQVRDGHIKQADAGTGSLAVELHRLRGVPLLYTTYRSPSDPNYYDDNTFKDSLSKLLNTIKPVLVLDLHGSHPYRPYDVDFGTMNGKSYLDKKLLLDTLVSVCYNNGLRDQSLDFFAGEKNSTVIKFVSSKGYPGIQLEINSVFLMPGEGNGYAQKTAKLLQALLRYIDVVGGMTQSKLWRK